MNWQEVIKEVKLNSNNITYQLKPPLRLKIIQAIESKLKTKIPTELRQLYLETNGIDEYIEHQLIGELIWNGERLIEENLSIRNDKAYKEIYKPLDSLLFFGGAGNGDLFAFNLKKDSDIYCWNHENDERFNVAKNLNSFIKNFITGKIKV